MGPVWSKLWGDDFQGYWLVGGQCEMQRNIIVPQSIFRILFDFGAEHLKQCAHSHHIWSCLGGAGTSWGVGSKARTLPKMAGAGRGLNKPPQSCHESPGDEADVSRIQIQGLEEEIREHEEVRPHHFTKVFIMYVCMFFCKMCISLFSELCRCIRLGMFSVWHLGKFMGFDIL